MNYQEDYPEYITIGALILASLSGLLIESLLVLTITSTIIGIFIGRLWHRNKKINPSMAPLSLTGVVMGFTFTSFFHNLKIIILALFIGTALSYFICEQDIF